MKRISLSIIAVLACLDLQAQIEQPVKWSFSAKALSEKEVLITLKAKIDKGWHIYSQFTPDGGPVPTSFTFKPAAEYKLSGKVKEQSKPTKIFEEAFEVDVLFFDKEAVFQQKIDLQTDKDFTLTGELEFMVCNDVKCLPPEIVEFSVPVKAAVGQSESSSLSAGQSIGETPASIEEKPGETAKPAGTNPDKGELKTPESKLSAKQWPVEDDSSLWSIFFGGFIGGFLALLTPCVFPMIPLTVSYFTKRAGNRSKSIAQATIYGISIIVIYVALGFGVTLLFGADALNDLASNAFFNLLFFIILVVFAISFFGAFEITLPSSFVNKMDAKADQGGLIGIFFMAFTLALVSFSCTGPIIGTLLVQAAVNGSTVGPLMGMTGFSLALALPFALFAIFPAWMHSLPKSGGWLNSVKVVLGFLELALALKFLSNVDLAYHWGILDREVFLVLWIIIFGMLGFYLLGKLRFSHDSELQYISIPRMFMAILSLAFALYMIPGLWGAPLKAISAFAPPQATQDFDLNNGKISAATGAEQHEENKKYADLFHCPHNLNCFFDYEEGMTYAKKNNKPVMIDFTGHSCVNCRKMEASVWSEPEVLKRLNQDYVLISLYVDDKTELAEDDKYTSSFSGKKIKTIGNKWSDLQASKYGTNSQPYYVLLDHQEKVLAEPRGFDQDIPDYVKFLDSGLAKFKNGNGSAANVTMVANTK